MFLKLYFLNRYIIIKVQWRVWCLLCLPRKNNLLRLFVRIKVESHFPLNFHSIYFAKVTIQISCLQIYIIDYRKKWSIVWICCETFWKIVYIDKKNNGPRIDPCGMPDSILDSEDSWTFNINLCFLRFKKLVRVLKKLPDIPFCFNLKIRPLRHTLSKALDMSKNTDQTSIPSSKDL